MNMCLHDRKTERVFQMERKGCTIARKSKLETGARQGTKLAWPET
jgi:hypothetical protein